MAVIPLSFGLFGGGSDEVTATKAQVLTGYTAITADSADEPIEGTIPIKSGQTYYPTLSNQSIAQGQYLGGIQVINKITPSNITAGNIKAGTTVKVNNGNADIINVTGTYSTPSSGQNPIVSSKVLTGYSGFVNGGAEVKGNIPLKQAQTYNVSGSDQSITAGQYLNGAQTFRGVTTSNINAENIKKDVVVKVGDAGNSGRIKNVTGTYTTPSSGQNPVTADKMLSGYSGFVNGGAEVKGNIPLKQAQTYDVSSSDQNITAGQYLNGTQTFRGVTTSNIDAGNIRKGVVAKVGDAGDNGRIKNVTGTYSTPSSGQSPVIAGAMLSGYSGFVNGGSEVKGNIPSKSAATYNVSGSDQTVAAGQYLSGAQTFKGVTTSNIDAGNIKKGVNVKVGDSANTGRIKNITGTYTTPSSGQSPVTANKMLSGYSGFVNGGSEVKGSIPSKAAATYNTSTSDQSIASGQYLSGTQTIKAVTTSNISAGNIKKGVNIKVGDANSAGRIANVTGTYTTPSSGQNPVVAGAMLQGYSGFVNGGGEVKGTIVNRGQFQYGNMAEAGDYYAFNDLPEGAYFKNGADWAPEARCSKDNVRNYLGVSAEKIAKGQSIAGIWGTWYGNKATIGVSAYDMDAHHNDKYFEQSFTMPASGTVYYGGCSGGRYFNLNANATCAIYKNGSVMDDRNISNGNYPFRGTMLNKSFSANAGDVIKVVASCEQGSSANFIMSSIQAVIVY
jgi:hypothetical protein